MRLIANIKAMGNSLLVQTRKPIALKDGEYEVNLREVGDNHSDEQRRMLWGVIMDISKALYGDASEKDNIYLQLLEMSGARYELLTLKIDAFEQGALDMFGIRNYRKIKEKNGFVSVIAFYGLSNMNKKETSQLIDTTIRYASEVGVEVDEDYWKGLLSQ